MPPLLVLSLLSCVTSNRRYKQHHAELATGELKGWDRGQCHCKYDRNDGSSDPPFVQLSCDDATDDDDTILYFDIERVNERLAISARAQATLGDARYSAFYAGPAIVELASQSFEDPEGDITAVYRPFFVHDLYLPAAHVCDWVEGDACGETEESQLMGGRYPCEDLAATRDLLTEGL